MQGSTCVYSRKVEHVYQLVMQTIDFLTNKQQTSALKAANRGREDDDVPSGDVSQNILLCSVTHDSSWSVDSVATFADGDVPLPCNAPVTVYGDVKHYHLMCKLDEASSFTFLQYLDRWGSEATPVRRWAVLVHFGRRVRRAHWRTRMTAGSL